MFGASLPSVRLIVIVAVSVSPVPAVPEPLPPESVTVTVNVNVGVVSKSTAAGLATRIWPLFGLIVNALEVFPPVMA